MTIRARVKPSWPILVAGEGGVTVAQSKGRAVIGFDYENSELGSELAQAVSSATTQAGNAQTSATAAAASAVDAATAAGSLTYASQAEAEAGTVTDKAMSPLRTVQAIAANVADQSTAEGQTDNTKIMSPLRASQLIIKREGYINVEDYGAIGDGLDSSASTNATAFANACAALGSNGGKIIVPYGRFHTDDAFADLLDTKGVTFEGQADAFGLVPSSSASGIVYTGTAGNLIRLDGTQAIKFRNLSLSYNSASYGINNPLINLETVSGSSVTAYAAFENCFIGGWNGSAKNAMLMDLKKTIGISIDRCFLQNCYYGIVGGRATGDFSNVVTITRSEFNSGFSSGAIIAAGCNWSVDHCIFEPPRGVTGAAGLNSILVSPIGIQSLSVYDSSFEDGGDNSDSWISLTGSDYGAPGIVSGFNVVNSLFQCGNNASAGTAIDFGSVGVFGGNITANHFNRDQNIGFIANGATASKMNVIGNNVDTSGGPGVGKIFVSGVPTGASVWDNNDGVGLHVGSGKLLMTGLPTADPHVAGQLWKNSGVLTVSAG